MLEQKVFIITGAGRGLGRAAALDLAENGATVVINGITDEGEDGGSSPSETTLNEVKDKGGDGIVHHGDVSSFEYCDNLIQDTLDEFGRIDGVATYAGIVSRNKIHDSTKEEWDRQIEVNLSGHFYIFHHVAKYWTELAQDQRNSLDSERTIVGVSSRAALGANVGANYCASKAGILGLVWASAIHLSKYNIRVNAILPTGHTRITPNDRPPATCTGPVATYLLSDRSAGISGVAVCVQGNRIGILKPPEIIPTGYREEGWTIDKIDDHFRQIIAESFDLNRTRQPY